MGKENIMHISSYYKKDVKSFPNSKKHIENCEKDILNSLALLKNLNKKIVLMFSGGADSTLLACMMKSMNIPFIPVLIVQDPSTVETVNDLPRAKKMSELLKINLEVIHISFDKEKLQFKNIIPKVLFDRHYGIIHSAGIREITNKYGNDIIIVNGQSADSVLSFGPSDRSFRCFLRRLQLYIPLLPILAVSNIMFSVRLHQRFKTPKTISQKLDAFFDEQGYVFLQNGQNKIRYNQYISAVVRKTLVGFTSNKKNKQMFLKINGFLQGSDNHIVLAMANYYNCGQVFMPYCTPQFIYETIKNKNNIRELFDPKYVIYALLKKYHFDYSYTAINSNGDVNYFAYYESQIMNDYYEFIKENYQQEKNNG